MRPPGFGGNAEDGIMDVESRGWRKELGLSHARVSRQPLEIMSLQARSDAKAKPQPHRERHVPGPAHVRLVSFSELFTPWSWAWG
jgi:hypothetical protein